TWSPSRRSYSHRCGDQTALFEVLQDELRALFRLVLLRVDAHLGIARLLVRVVDTGEALDLTLESLLIETLDVAARALLDGRGDVHLDERAPLLDELPRLLARLLVRRDRRCDHRGAVSGQARGYPADSLDVRVTVLLREPEPLRQVRAHRVAVEVLDDRAAFLDCGTDEMRNGRLARARKPGEPQREPAVSAPLRFRMLVRIDVLSHSTPSLVVYCRGCRTRACPSRPSVPLVRPRPRRRDECTGCSRWTDSPRRAAGCRESR